MEQNYQQCARCVLDTTAKYITFDEHGICDSCRKYDTLAKRYIDIPKEKKEKELDFIISQIKRSGNNNEYDCILGLSGGVDSSYLAHMAKVKGLRPLIVHFDNGWNTELAVKNIENIVTKLDYNLFTYVINWEEFKDLQLAYLKASVVDTEVPTDYLIFAVLNKIAAEKNIKYILSGYNYATEYGMPKGWNMGNKFDTVNLRNIHKQFGSVPLKDFPDFGLYKRFYYQKVLGIETVALLNYIDYNKKQVKAFLQSELEWKDYGGKHYESVFTRFYQGYLLPVKFNIDKRKAHWSALICSKQATREEALQDIEKPTYPEEMQKEDLVYVAKKFNITQDQLTSIIETPPVEHAVYGFEDRNDTFYKLFTLIMEPYVRVMRKVRFVKATGKWKF